MIVIDVSVLTTLKTFAMLRSLVRYYFHKVGDARSCERKGGQRRGNRRTRKEWRVEVERATNYKEYCSIDLFEPREKTVTSNVIAEPGKGSIASPKSPFGLRLRRCSTDASDASSLSSNTALNESPSSKFMRRASSCAQPYSEAYDDGGDRVKQIVKDDLGSTGSMLLSTLSILKEARIKVLNINGYHENKIPNDSFVAKNDSLDALDDDEDVSIGEMFNDFDLPPTISMDSKEDYSSALKALLSGIVKRNHLSIDDFVMQDARSVAERGQHSLQRETREAIVSYGEEVEKCIDWVASGVVSVDGVDGENCSMSCESQTSNSRYNKSRDQTMRSLHDELSKRCILFKRMKQNLGNTALMLSGGGAQAMYHLGTIKALVESNLFQHVHVISGTSGGR